MLVASAILSGTEGRYCDKDEGLCTRISQDPIIDPCQDKHEFCKLWAAEGECENNPDYMLKFCSRSCGVCPHFGVDSNDFRTNDDACRDLKETIECEKFAKLGHCLLNHTFMEDNCRATCFFCVNEKSLKEAGFSKPEMYVQLKCQVSFNDTFSHITFFCQRSQAEL